MTSDSIGSATHVESALHGPRHSQQREGAAASVRTQTQQTQQSQQSQQSQSAAEKQSAQPQPAVRKSEDGGDAGYQDEPGRGQNLDLET